MAGLLDDPARLGLLQFGLGMLQAGGPNTQRVGLGQGIAAGAQQGIGAYQQQKRAMSEAEERAQMKALRDAQMAKILADAERARSLAGKGIDPQLPSTVQEWQFFNSLPKEDQPRYLEMKRQLWKVGDIGGVPSLIPQTPGMQTQPLSTLERETSGQAAVAGAKQRAQEIEKARYDLMPTYDRTTNQIQLKPRLGMVPEPASLQREKDAARRDAERITGVRVPEDGGPAVALSPKQQEIDQEVALKRKAADNSIRIVDNTLEQVDKAIAGVGPFTAGFGGSVLGSIPGTPAYDLQQVVLTVRANLGFDRLQAMRDASPTGGALGQVAIQELAALQSSIASLDPKQSPPELISNLRRVKKHYEAWKQVLQSTPQPQGGRSGGPAVGDVIDGYRFKGGNPADRNSWELAK